MLGQRIVTAAVLLALFMSTLFLGSRFMWDCLTLAFVACAAWEWGRLLDKAAHANHSAVATPPIKNSSISSAALCASLTLILGGLYIAATTWVWPGLDAMRWVLLSICLAYWLLRAPLGLRIGEHVAGSNRLLDALLATALVLAAWIAIIELTGLGVWLVLSCLMIVWIADTGAYFSGRAFGTTKLAPAISPGKTWAGVWGGMAAVTIYLGILLLVDNSNTISKRLEPLIGVWAMLLFAFVITAYSVIGDLYESKLKREAGAKDSSQLLPGHGGVLDRIDALLPTMPLCYLLIAGLPKIV
jgi:phosphatidate cytidylyltransferase